MQQFNLECGRHISMLSVQSKLNHVSYLIEEEGSKLEDQFKALFLSRFRFHIIFDIILSISLNDIKETKSMPSRNHCLQLNDHGKKGVSTV